MSQKKAITCARDCHDRRLSFGLRAKGRTTPHEVGLPVRALVLGHPQQDCPSVRRQPRLSCAHGFHPHRDNGRPGLRTDYAPTYYSAFLLDADGNNIEAVCMK